MRYVPLTLILLFASGPALAQESKPAGRPTPGQRAGERPDAAAEILLAAEHLEAAGLSDLADRLRSDADAVRHATAEKLLEQRLAELDALRSEVSALRQATGRQQQVRLNLQVIEIDSDKLRIAGLDLEAILNDGGDTTNAKTPAATAHCYAGVVDSDHRILEAAQAICAKGTGTMLADPQLLTVGGRPAWFNSGGQFPILEETKQGAVTIAYKKYGTGVEVVPRELGGRALELNVRVRIAELDDSRSIKAGSTRVPGLHVREAETTAQLTVGQTLVIGGLKQSPVENRPARGKQRATAREVLVLVRPELLDEPPPVVPRTAKGARSQHE